MAFMLWTLPTLEQFTLPVGRSQHK